MNYHFVDLIKLLTANQLALVRYVAENNMQKAKDERRLVGSKQNPISRSLQKK